MTREHVVKPNREALRQLADYLASGTLKMEFDMEAHMRSNGFEITLPQRHECGTCACAVGHGPSAGIPVPEGVTDWWEYCEAALGVSEESSLWWGLFAARWAQVDNTPKGAAARIYRFLDTGRIVGRLTEWGE